MKRALVIVGLGAAAIVILWWFYLRSAAPSLSPRISWHSGGRDFAVTLHVTRGGHPISNYPIGVETVAGGIIQLSTDSAGEAVPRLGSSYPWSDVRALHVSGRRVALRPFPLGDYFLPCACYGGNTIEVRL